ncbi:MAG: hypothetical protein BWK73_24550 [Thiothrix lacustris]|uniref:CBM-cenC domain-containing protein n=1 Tax=Thiothrix lacustris TaxID=525917 RepID=A0A1Y1QLT1_9GAMM|nr:MAG: hypothetical protein BWK73_24550 [Thiothrix lacustris]
MVQRLILLVVIGLLGWQAVTMGVAQMRSERLAAIYLGSSIPWTDAIDSIPPNASINLTSDAWVSLADQALTQDNLNHAEAYLWRAIQRNISSGGAVARLLNIRNTQGKIQEVDNIAVLSIRLWPVHEDTLLRASAHWLKKGDIAQLLPLLDKLLTQTPAYNAGLFPALHTLAQTEETAPFIKQYAHQAPAWWPAFFNYLTLNETNLSVVEAYYQARQQATKPLLKSEQMPYINRLLQAQEWQQARKIWLTTLAPTEQALAHAMLYDGGFEGSVHNEGFAWHFNPTTGVAIDTKLTGGINGKRALHIAFKQQKTPIHFQQVSQRLVLPTGDYSLSLRYRLDGLNTRKGLQWRVRCDAGATDLLGESITLKGSGSWQTLAFEFSVPDTSDTAKQGCTAQLLRLEAASQYAHDHLFEGGLWFDDIAIKAVEP